MVAGAILNFAKSEILDTGDHSVAIPTLMHISRSASEIWPKIQIQGGGLRYLEFYENSDFCPIDTGMANIYLHTKFDANTLTDNLSHLCKDDTSKLAKHLSGKYHKR